jgi:hypothetical protein
VEKKKEKKKAFKDPFGFPNGRGLNIGFSQSMQFHLLVKAMGNSVVHSSLVTGSFNPFPITKTF